MTIEDFTSANYLFIQLNQYSLNLKSSVSIKIYFTLKILLLFKYMYRQIIICDSDILRCDVKILELILNKQEIISFFFRCTLTLDLLPLYIANNLILVYLNDVYKSFKSIEEKKARFIVVFFFPSLNARISCLSTHLIGFPLFFFSSLICYCDLH